MNKAKNQGEGDRESARRYNERATEHAHSGKVEKEAREAANADDAEKAKMRKAEEAGKARAKEEDPAVRRR